ncbi:MAG: hypothetical protein ABR606_08110 [Vicinamibacterales bacterium]
MLIDVINDLAFVGAEALIRQAEPMADRLARLKGRAAKSGVPVIYVNDSLGRWRSDFDERWRIAQRPVHRARRSPHVSGRPRGTIALEQMRTVLKADIRPSVQLTFKKDRAGKAANQQSRGRSGRT